METFIVWSHFTPKGATILKQLFFWRVTEASLTPDDDDVFSSSRVSDWQSSHCDGPQTLSKIQHSLAVSTRIQFPWPGLVWGLWGRAKGVGEDRETVHFITHVHHHCCAPFKTETDHCTAFHPSVLGRSALTNIIFSSSLQTRRCAENKNTAQMPDCCLRMDASWGVVVAIN